MNTNEKQLNTVPRVRYLTAFLRNNAVLVVALVAAAITYLASFVTKSRADKRGRLKEKAET